MSKKKIKRLNKKFYVTDEYGHTDEVLVNKVNELVEIVNQLREENAKLKILNGGRK